MIHLVILWLCFLSYVQLGKMDSTIPHPKPHLTLTCFLKILTNIPFSVGLHVSYFQNVTKLVRDVLLFCYIISQYYLFEFSLVYRFVNFEIFAAFVLPLVLEGWMPSHPNYLFYLFKFYSLYLPLFINQFCLHEGRVIQTIFLLALIEIPSMAHNRSDKDIPEIPLNSYVFKVVQLPYDRVAILQCAKKSIHGINQIELAIACIRRSYWQKTLVIIKRTPVSPNTCDLNYNPSCDLLMTSCCSELSIFNAKTLQLLKVHSQPRAFKKLQFVQNDGFFASLNKINSSQWLLTVSDSIFNKPFSQHPINLDSPIELSRFIKYSTQSGRVQQYLYICVPSDRLNCLIVVDIHRQEVSEQLATTTGTKNQLKTSDILQEQENVQLDLNNQEFCQNEQKQLKIQNQNTKDNTLDSDVFSDDCDVDPSANFFWRGYIPKDLLRRFLISSAPCGEEVNLFQHLKKEGTQEDKLDEGVKEYLIDVSAIKDIFVYQHLLVISCSENIVFFDLKLRCVVKKISTLGFDMRVHWIRVTEEYTYYLFSNEIKAWMAKQHNETHKLEIMQQYNFYGIQSVLENTDNQTLTIIYNSNYNQKVAIIDIFGTSVSM